MAYLIGRLAEPGEVTPHPIGQVVVMLRENGAWLPLHWLTIQRAVWDNLDDDIRAVVLSCYQVCDVGPDPVRCVHCGRVGEPGHENSAWRYYDCACGARWKVSHGLLPGRRQELG